MPTIHRRGCGAEGWMYSLMFKFNKRLYFKKIAYFFEKIVFFGFVGVVIWLELREKEGNGANFASNVFCGC